ncbi:MAG: NTP transferase domain-containing protein [Oscillospiraceae bacterium]|nr:NTP transferase domain-containing protein [Oscillospiraceae bacterium]
MKAFILAGGAGSRMFPFDEEQKAVLPVGNVPCAVRLFDTLRRCGVRDVTVVTGRGRRWVLSAFAGRDVRFADAGPDTLGEVLRAEAGDADAVAVFYGDIYVTDGDAKRLLAEKGAAALVQDERAGFDKSLWIGAKVTDGAVEYFCGHARAHYVNARSGGGFLVPRALYACFTDTPPVFSKVSTGDMPPEGFWIESCLQTAIGRGAAVRAVAAEGPFADIDYPWELMAANAACARYECAQLSGPRIDPTASVAADAACCRIRAGKNTVIGPGVVFRGAAVIGSDTVIRNGAVIEDGVLIGDGCVIEDYCKIGAGSVVGDRCKVRFTAEVGGVLMEGAAAVHNCELYGVFGRDTDIGAGTRTATLRFDDAFAEIRVGGKKIAHPLTGAAFMGSYSRTGVNCTLLPGVRIGARACVGPGVVAGGRVEHGSMLLCEQSQTSRPWGSERYGW